MKTVAMISAAAILVSGAAFAAEKMSAVYSPKCDQEKVQKLVGDAGKVEKGAFEGGFNVTLDEGKLSFADLTKKLQAESCI